jgi:hypothetical protein
MFSISTKWLTLHFEFNTEAAAKVSVIHEWKRYYREREPEV